MRKIILALVMSAVLGGGGGMRVCASPVEFAFKAPDRGNGIQYARELWAEVTTPDQRTLRLPAFYAGEGVFAVRARAESVGEYRLGKISETAPDGSVAPADCQVEGSRSRRVTEREVESMPQIGLDPKVTERFATKDGGSFAPLGANLAWAESDDPVAWYGTVFHQFSTAGLNWARIWMSSWGRLDLTWLPDDMGKSPTDGSLDERIARNWDLILTAAEQEGVYVQLVLQHHGQWSSQVNPNWAGNPWNAANPGGFLHTAGEFFTSSEAKRRTKQKYRTIVARWGYSPAIMAWELFNEVHWVDALRLDHNEPAVAAWHDEMAAYLRSLDVYGHLVTTSTENLASPIYRSMDYYQPHLYPIDPLPAARRFDARPAEHMRPIFYGEQGDDHLQFSAAQRDSGAEIAPVVWASLMGDGRYAAQPWEGAQLLAQGRLGELGAVAKFLHTTRLNERGGLAPFSPRVAGTERVKLRLVPAERWHPRAPQTIQVEADGRVPMAYGTLPAIFVGSPDSLADGYSNRLTLQVDFPERTAASLHIATVAATGAGVRILVDGEEVVRRELEPGHAVELPFVISPGAHALGFENTGAADWFEVGGWSFDREVPALAAIGRRSTDFIAVWVWQRDQVFTLSQVEAVAGELILDAVEAGDWQVAWWSTETGEIQRKMNLHHAGGTLRLPSPPIQRHAAVVLERQ